MRFRMLLLAATLFACTRSTPEPDRIAADAGSTRIRIDAALVASGRVTVARVERRALRGDLRLAGEVVPAEAGSADVGALVAGRIASIPVKIGDRVKRGQPLAYLDSPEAARIAADAIRARARVTAAERKFERMRALQADKATSASAVDEASVELAAARADLAASRTLLASLGIPEPSGDAVVAARVPLKSPIDGVVVEQATTLGASIAPDNLLFRVVASDRIVVDVRLTDATMPAPAPGAVTALLLGGDARCAGHVVASAGVVDARTRARHVRVVPDGVCPGLVIGGFVDATFTSAAAPVALAVPRAAVVDVRGAPTVFVATTRPGEFEPRIVRVGITTAEDAAIEDGLDEDAQVAVAGTLLLKGELLRSVLE